jgi:hypothetical protein
LAFLPRDNSIRQMNPRSPALSRRDFLAHAGFAAAAACLAPSVLSAAEKKASPNKAAATSYDVGILENWFFDGGVKAENVAEVVRRGARVVVAGSAIFVGGEGIHANTAALRAEIARATG